MDAVISLRIQLLRRIAVDLRLMLRHGPDLLAGLVGSLCRRSVAVAVDIGVRDEVPSAVVAAPQDTAVGSHVIQLPQQDSIQMVRCLEGVNR